MNELELITKQLEGIAGQQKAIQEGQKSGVEKFDQVEKRLDEVAARLKACEDINRGIAGAPVPGLKEDKDGRKFSMLKAIRYTITGDRVGNEIEADALAVTRKAVAFPGSDNTAPSYNAIPQEIASEIIELLRARTALDRLGVRVLSGLTGHPFRMPSFDTGATAYWLGGASSPITESTPVLGEKNMDAKKVAALIRIPNEWLTDAIAATETMLREDMAQILADAVDIQCIQGDGTSNTPIGLTGLGIQSQDLGPDGNTGTLFSILKKHVSILEGKLEDANVMGLETAKFLSLPNVKRSAKSVLIQQFSGDTEGEPLMLPMNDAQLKDRIGYDWIVRTGLTQSLTKGTATGLTRVILGVWNQFVVGYWQRLDIAASNQEGNAFTKDQTAIRAIIRVGCQVRQPKAFVQAADIEMDASV